MRKLFASVFLVGAMVLSALSGSAQTFSEANSYAGNGVSWNALGPFQGGRPLQLSQVLAPWAQMPYVYPPNDPNFPSQSSGPAIAWSYGLVFPDGDSNFNSSSNVYTAGVSVAANASFTTNLVTGETSCTYPSFSGCNIVYASSSGVVAVTQTIGTATAAGNTILAFVETNSTGSGAVVSVIYPYQITQNFLGLGAAQPLTLTLAPPAQASSATPSNGTQALSSTGGAGGASTAAGTAGGNGGTSLVTTGAGGAGASTGTGGNGGENDIQSGVGGAAAGSGATGGNGGLIKILAGNGGGTVTGGVGGVVTVQAGNGGNGSTAGGAGGAVNVTAGSAGTGGTPNGGSIVLSPGQPTSTGVMGSVTIAGGAGAAHLITTQTTPPAASGTCTTPAVAAGSTDSFGQVSCASSTTAQTIIATFNSPWASAPFCTITPANAASAINTSVTTTAWASASTTALTVTLPTGVSITAPAFNYTCVR